MATFSGPTRPSTDKKKFKKTGKVTKKDPVFSGPTRPSTDTKKFRRSGSSRRRRSSSSKQTSSQITEKQKNELLAKQVISDLLTKDNLGRLKPKQGLTSSVAKEEQRKKDEKIIQASIPRTFTSQKQIISLNIAKKQARDRTIKELTKDLLKQTSEQKLLNNFQTGQSLTPSQLKEVNQIIDKKAKKLSNEQLSLLKNAPKEIVTGLFEVGKDTLLIPVKAVKGSYNYGTSLVKRFEKGENNPLFKDIGSLGRGSISVGKYVLNNPKKSAVIVGLAATTVGTSLLTEFIKNPIKTTTKAVAILFSGKIIGKIGSGFKAISRSEKVRSVLHAQRFSSNKFRVTSDLTTGVSKIKGKTSGTFLNGKKFTTEYSLRLNPKTKEINGILKTKVGKKIIVERVNLIDKQGFYLNPKTGEKIPKIITGIKSRSITLKETTLKPIAKTTKTFIQDGAVAKTQDADFTTIITRIIDNTKKVTKKTGTIRLAKVTKGEKTQIKNFANRLLKESKVTKSSISKPLTNSEIKRLESFIDNVGIQNLKGLDRRIKIAKVLGINKTSKLLKPLETAFDDLGKVKSIKFTKGKAVFKGEIIAKTKPPIKFNIKTRKLSDLRKSKKGQISLVKNDTILIKKRPGTKFTTDRIIQIPRLKSTVPLTIPKLKSLRLLGKMTSVLTKLTLLDKIQDSLIKTSQTPTQINKLINDVITDIKKINDIIKINQIKSITETATTPKTFTRTTSGGTTKKVTTPPIKITTPKPSTPPPKLPKIPFLKLSLDSKLPSGSRLKFDILVREKGKVKRITLGQPKNKALLRLSSGLDNSLSRSAQLVISGTTKLKDITSPNLKKFRLAKTKKTLKLVEKTKFSIDKAGEKKGLSLARALKPKKKKKVLGKKKKK